MKSQLDRRLELNYRDLKLNDPIASLDIAPLFQRAVEKFPLSEEDQGTHHVIDNLPPLLGMPGLGMDTL